MEIIKEKTSNRENENADGYNFFYSETEGDFLIKYV